MVSTKNRLNGQEKARGNKYIFLIEEEVKKTAIRMFIAGMLELVAEANEAGLIEDAYDLGAVGRMLKDFAAGIEGGDEEPFLYGDANDQLMDFLGYESPTQETITGQEEAATGEVEAESMDEAEDNGPISAMVARTMSNFFTKVAKLDINSPYRIGYVARQMNFMCKDMCEPFSDNDLFQRSLAGDFNDEEFSQKLADISE